MNGILYIFFIILFAIFIGCLILIGGFLVARGKKITNYNLILIGIGFLTLPIGFIGTFIFNLDFLFQEIFVFISFVIVVIFTNMTFHRHQRFLSNLILSIVLILGLIQIVFHAVIAFTPLNPYYSKVILDVPYTFLVFDWLSWSSFSAYKSLKNQNIQPWIKLRYKIISIFSFIISLHIIPEFFQPVGVLWGDPSNLASLLVFGTTAILAVVFSIGFAFAWIMPDWTKKLINKDYKPLDEEELTEEEFMNLLKNQLDHRDRDN